MFCMDMVSEFFEIHYSETVKFNMRDIVDEDK